MNMSRLSPGERAMRAFDSMRREGHAPTAVG
jgi:pentatricopeptide repeat protein